jgi:hypothetical protein
MRDMKWFTGAKSRELRKLQNEAKEERKAIRADITTEVEQERVYTTLDYLKQKGGPKLSREEFKAAHPDAPLPRGITAVKGLPADSIVSDPAMSMWTSGAEMMEALSDYENKRDRIERLTEQRMLAENGEMVDPQAIAESIDEALHNDAHIKFLHTEMNTLARLTGKPSVTAREAKLSAQRAISRMRKGQLSPSKFLQLAARESRLADKAWKRGDREAAATHKKGEVLYNHYYRAARDAQKKVAIQNRYVKKFSRPGVRKNIGREQLDQIDQIFEKVGLRNAGAADRATFADWYKKELDEGESLVMEPGYMETLKTSYPNMTIEEANGFIDTIKNIEHIGREKQKIIVGTEKQNLSENAGKVWETATGSNKQIYDPENRQSKMFEEKRRWFSSAFASLIRPEYLAEQMDGFKEGGLFWNMMFRPIADAENRVNVMREEAYRVLEPILASNTFKHLKTKIFINDKAGYYTKDQVVSMALNLGNDGNLTALVEGMENQQVTETDIRRILNENLTKEDWNNVQAIWDYIDTYWAEIDALQFRLTGVHPEKVDPIPVETPFGTLKGGYYPIVHDSEHSYRTFARDQKLGVDQILGGNILRPYTKHGHTMSRVGSAGMPIKLSTAIVGQHIANVTQDLAYREAVISVDKVIQNAEIRDAIERIAGKEVYRTLRPWLSNVAAGQRMITDPGEILAKGFRKNATLVSMGAKLSTAFVQPLGYTQTVELLGEKWALNGITEFYGNPLKAQKLMKQIQEESPMMKARPGAFDRDINQAISHLKGDKGALEWLQEHAYKHIAYMDMLVAYPSYIGGKNKALAEGKSLKDAIALGERAVRLSQSSGNAKDLPPVAYGSEYKNLFTMFYTYFSSFHNLARRRAKISGNKPMSMHKVAENTMAFMYLAAMPAVLSEILVGRGPDDDEEWATWAAKNMVTYPALGMIGIRDVVQAATSGYKYTPTPVAQAAETIFKAATQPGKLLELDKTALKTFTMANGYIFGLPSRQLWILMNNTNDLIEGEDLSFPELIMLREHYDR